MARDELLANVDNSTMSELHIQFIMLLLYSNLLLALANHSEKDWVTLDSWRG